MSETIEDLTIHYEEDGQVIVKELDKEVLTKGAWTTIMFRYKQLDRKSGEYGKDMYTIRRFRKMKGEYRPQSKFNISSPDQARKIIDALEGWIKDLED
ncbi:MULTISPECIES: hypothetical protein [Maridesulfovibrio]|uniref:Uncharacterized protein n=1 Tax=Maridesulfovibrio salexigens (strain ATCC 14822 / DSM 2638 / NCIMB 8403 / VKM B-1763) TaxID=526222 RepID=C6BWA3_MARSD|nr:hypothetical protein [Maridesulfovibrio salexigens]ACS78347.1 conserved hypothetical protein [Maridesulfovibrio salexigens DSM 2638]MDC7217951.1 hypothetical protein [Spirochaetales bacterium]